MITTNRLHSIIGAIIVVMVGIVSVSCLKNDDRTIMLTVNSPMNDDMATPNPVVVEPNITLPNIQYTVIEDEQSVRFDMTGIQSPTTKEWLRLKGTDFADSDEQNTWVEVDDKPKYVYINNLMDDENEHVIKNDFIFLVDNSGSMDDEADRIAADIAEWAAKLSETLDVRFACVGYDGKITGAIDFCSHEELTAYLNRESLTGINRTMGFEGANAAELEQKKTEYDGTKNKECSMASLLFANDLFSFREGANRIYVNFTDELTYKYGDRSSVEFLKSQDNWNTSQGTIHTVFSNSIEAAENDKADVENRAQYEHPWLMSVYTGGTVIFTDKAFTGVSLDMLPVTDAMKNSYILTLPNGAELLDGQYHNVKVTIVDNNQDVRATRDFKIKFEE